jgi:hypothetical protein
MNETDNTVATTEATKEKKAPTPSVKVAMTDGRTVEFVGKRRMIKETGEEGTAATVRFDFVDGSTRSIKVDLTDPLALKLLAHGIAQKVGDETAGEKEVGDMVLAVDAILERLSKGEWGIERGASDGFSGASTVIRALVEVTGKDLAWVKAFLEKKLEDGKAAGLTRQKLYAAFKAPGTKTAPVIARLEAEKASKDSGIDGDAAINEMLAG